MDEILNERQYWTAKSKLRELNAELEESRSNPEQLSPKAQKSVLESLNAQIIESVVEISEYEAIKKSGGMRFYLESLDDLPRVLLGARLSLGWTQERLADELNMPKQQIQRYEVTFYESASFRRILEVADALGVGFSGTAETYSSQRRLSGLDPDIVRHTLSGFSAAAAFQEAESRLRIRSMTDHEARQIFDDLCDTHSHLSEIHETRTMKSNVLLDHKLSQRRAMEVLARKRGDIQ